ncbi:hypothetical protein EK21DRAFT_41639, partial [Setomelanomma holmii]
NYTIALPTGSSGHGQPGLLCTPAKAIDLLTFYLLNYVAHAATVLTKPGERADDYFASVIGSWLFPALGLYRGIEAILCGAVLVRNDDLRKAARSGAPCMVVRAADWRPGAGECIVKAILKRKRQEGKGIHIFPYSPPYMFNKFRCHIFVHRRIIHGTHSLPAGYCFALLPDNAEFEAPAASSDARRLTVEVSVTYNNVKALIALAQSAYALTTLYRARGDQIEQYGYAAFGLTVAQYAVMFITNLIGNLCRPEYPSLYMVESSMMDEARRQGGHFNGAVARV